MKRTLFFRTEWYFVFVFRINILTCTFQLNPDDVLPGAAFRATRRHGGLPLSPGMYDFIFESHRVWHSHYIPLVDFRRISLARALVLSAIF